MFFLVILFIVVPIAELYVIIKVGEAIGILPTLALLFLDAILGSLLLRHQGRGAWRRFNEALAQGRFPGTEVVDGLLIVIGGTLLLAPVFITDIVGLLFLIPPTRAIVRAILKRFTIGRVAIFGTFGGGRGDQGGPGPFGPGGPGGQGPSRDYDYDVTAEEVPTNGSGDGRQLPRTDD
ncbi:MAG TPA: FxsA family protein [Solirubrobacterales bacterium]|nr:FxsA family protein [Solirubrobacterales bacterium]